MNKADPIYYWFSDYMLEDTFVHLAYNSLLITLDIYYPEDGDNYQVKEVVKLDYQVQRFIPYNNFFEGGGI